MASPASNDPPPETKTSWYQKIHRQVIGAPRDIKDRTLLHSMSLIPVLAWIGLGADALSSSSYGPEAAFKAIGQHTYLAIGLAIATAITVALISSAYSALIENFPNGGGYGVASKLLGEKLGLISGCALMVDYVLTITTSIAAAGDATFSFLPGGAMQHSKLAFEILITIALTLLNLRGVRESIVILAPMFLLFIITHVILIGGGILFHAPAIAATSREAAHGFASGLGLLGWFGMLRLFGHAYSLGGGTYTGIEAVSNALPLMREPRIANAKRTMIYLSVSLALCAGGLLICYLLWNTVPDLTGGKTMNALLAEQIGKRLPCTHLFVVLTLLSEAVLLIVAAQAGFLGGPRVLANMAVDSWLPHAFASISERLTTANGILIMALFGLGALLYTRGSVDALVIMYSINVFLTFSLTMLGMTRFWWFQPKSRRRTRRLVLFASTLALCATILMVTVASKFSEGGWVTLMVTGLLIALCFFIRWHYRTTNSRAAQLYVELGLLPLAPPTQKPVPLERDKATAVILVGQYGGLGIHTFLNVMRVFPHHYRQVMFISVGVMDSGAYKGSDAVEDLKERSNETLSKYVRLATAMGLPADSRSSIGIDAVAEAEKLCMDVAHDYPRSVFFAGKLIFEHEHWYHRLLHNNTAIALQKRLHWSGKSMMVMPARIVSRPHQAVKAKVSIPAHHPTVTILTPQGGHPTVPSASGRTAAAPTVPPPPPGGPTPPAPGAPS